MILTASTIQQAVGCSVAVAAPWVQPLTEACTAFGISTPALLFKSDATPMTAPTPAKPSLQQTVPR
ncbi:hypothetical protein LI078_06415 [Stenotrophomonas maltophilia]|nr:hypothetical protein [Stenotrophomonas geniculata]MCB7146196.1 hypothetical protein [Stenotrophomonas maltophilia]